MSCLLYTSYYLYGTRAENFGCKTGGFDVYTSTDLVNFSEAKECFNSEKYGLNKDVYKRQPVPPL